MPTIIACNIYKKIWELEYYEIIYVNWQLRVLIVRGRIWLLRPMCILHCLVSETFTQGYFIVGSPFTTLGQH